MWIYNPWIDKTLHWMDIGFIYYISYASSYCIEEHSHNKFCHNFGQKLFFQNYLFHQYNLNCGSLTASTTNSSGTWSQCSSIIWRHYATKYWYFQFLSLFPQKNKIQNYFQINLCFIALTSFFHGIEICFWDFRHVLAIIWRQYAT